MLARVYVFFFRFFPLNGLLKLRFEFLVGADTCKNCSLTLDWIWSRGFEAFFHQRMLLAHVIWVFFQNFLLSDFELFEKKVR